MRNVLLRILVCDSVMVNGMLNDLTIRYIINSIYVLGHEVGCTCFHNRAVACYDPEQ